MPDNNLQPLLDTQQNELAAVNSAVESNDTRNLGVFAANIAVLIYVAQSGFNLSGAQFLALSSAFVFSAACNVWLMFPEDYKGNVDVADHPEYLGLDNQSLMLQLISDTTAAIEYNKAKNAQRVRYFYLSLLLLIAGLACILTFVIIKTWRS